MKLVIAFFLMFAFSLQAQFQINGIVKDSDTKKGLPFATITTDNGVATIADVDGKFYFSLSFQPKALSISYVGYEKKTISLYETKSYFLIFLSPKTDVLKEVVLSNENPANAIIKKAIANKESLHCTTEVHQYSAVVLVK